MASQGFHAGKLLVATPKLLDPNFSRTVVLLLMHDENGAFGVVLNRSMKLAVAEILPGWAPHVAAPALLFQGGPVEQTAAIGIARLLREGAPGYTSMANGFGLLDLSRNVEDFPVDDLQDLRVFGGYAGWGAGQLEAELEEEAWFVVDAQPADPFSPQPDELWREILLRQPGKLAMFAYFPTDPASN